MILDANGMGISPSLGIQIKVEALREHLEVAEWVASAVQEMAIRNLSYKVTVQLSIPGKLETPKSTPFLTFAGHPVVKDWNLPEDVLLAKNVNGVEVGRIVNLAVPVV